MNESKKVDADYYESLSCSFLITDKIATEGVHIQNSLILGYRGKSLFKNAVGRFDKLMVNEKSSTYPWFLDYKRSSVTTEEESGTQTCTIYRDFETAWTDI